MLRLETDLQQIAKLKDKFEKYPPYAIGKGLDASAEYLNSPRVKQSIYPPSQAGQPFIWSSDRQRRKVMALLRVQGGPPYVRSNHLANSGTFKVNKNYSSLYIYYENAAIYAKWVIGNFTQIIGHIARGWKPVNNIVVDRERGNIVQRFKDAALRAWQDDAFIMGGGGGL